MNEPTVSVIVPVYNVEMYLERCLYSIVNQTYGNLEIILVDDGSKDRSGKMCDLWKKKDSRIRVIHKENEGLGYARNSGIEIATGEYVAYVDSDDYVELNAFQKVVERMNMTDADICYYGCVRVNSKLKHINYGVLPKKLYYDKSETMTYIKDILGPAPDTTDVLFGGVSAWSGVVKKQLLDEYNIRFPSERECLCEDIFYNIQVCMHANAIVIEPSRLYCYCYNGNDSLTTSYRNDRFEAALRMYNELNRLMVFCKNDIEIVHRLYRSLMKNLIVCIKQEVFYKKEIGYKKMYERIQKVCCDEIVQGILNDYPINRMPVKQRLLFNAIKSKHYISIFILTEIRMHC